MNTPPQPGSRPEPVTATTILAALKATSDEIGETKDEIRYLRRYGHINRLLIWAAVIGLVLDIAASSVAGYALFPAAPARPPPPVTPLPSPNSTPTPSPHASKATPAR